MRLNRLGIGSLFFLISAVQAYASDDFVKPKIEISKPSRSILLDFQKTQKVLDHFGVPPEDESQSDFSEIEGQRTSDQLNARLKFFDVKNAFARFTQAVSNRKTGRVLNVYQDRDSKTVPDFSVNLASKATQIIAHFDGYHQRLLQASRSNPPSQPLRGLKIGLDPGHMGSEFWDEKSGKYVTDHKGNKLSEGVLALETSLLLEKEFQNLGAEVLITHRTLNPVLNTPFEKFEMQDEARMALREKSLESWFINLLHSESIGAALIDAFENSGKVKKIFNETSTNIVDDYINADLQARVEVLDAFRPDLVLVIHFDTSSPVGDGNGLNYQYWNATKVYVPGGFLETELASRTDRKWFALQLLSPESWDDSLVLGRHVVSELHSELGLKYDLSGGTDSSIEVESGIFARNLHIPRRLTHSAVTYIECLYYNNPTEFYSFLKHDHTLQIGGEDYSYSNRLQKVADAIKAGVLNYVKEFK